MATLCQHIEVEARGPLRCVRLLHTRFEESQIDDLAEALMAVGAEEGCTTVALCLGPKSPECLYSIFLGKLVSVQRRLNEQGRKLLLCDAGPEVLAIFSSVKLADHFTFVADFKAAGQ